MKNLQAIAEENFLNLSMAVFTTVAAAGKPEMRV
jgi:hypothetical protein